MKSKKYCGVAVLVMILLACGCSRVADIKQKEAFSETSRAYRQAILWSDFEYAATFLKDSHQIPEIDPMYQKIKVTAYNERRHAFNHDSGKIEQTVQIQYYWIDQMIEKSIIDHPSWEWNPEAGFWFLSSDLPVFK